MAVIDGTPGNDSLSGTSDSDTISGLAGNDTLDGLDRNDSIRGGDGNDSLRGGNGADTIEGGNDRDTLDGGDGNDSLVGGSGFDFLFGGNGDDSLDGGVVDGGPGEDRLQATDRADYGNDPAGIVVDLAAGKATDGFGSVDTLIDIDTIFGTAFDDSIVGDDDDNFLTGGVGGNDTLDGAGGDDFLPGSEGDDRLSGGNGDDTVRGGNGLDTAVFLDARASYTLSMEIDTTTEFGNLFRGIGQIIVDRDGGGAEGEDTVQSTERIEFSDTTIVAPIFFTVTNAFRAEPDSGMSDLAFALTLSAASTRDVTVRLTATDGTAVVGADYVATSGIVTIPAGETSATFSVPINGDTVTEPTERFMVIVSDLVGASLRGEEFALATGTIVNDDGGPSANDDFANGLTTSAVLALGQPVMGAIESGSDVDLFRVTLAAGTTYRINQDGLSTNAGNLRNHSLRLLDGAGTELAADTQISNSLREASIEFTPAASGNFFVSAGGTASSTGNVYRLSLTTTADQPTVTISDAAVIEDDAGGLMMLFYLRRSLVSDQPVTVTATTSNGSAIGALDYTPTSEAVTIPGNQFFATFAVPILADNFNEPNESFTVTLSDPVGAVLGSDAAAIGTIFDDDGAPVSISGGDVVEGDGGTRDAVFTVRLIGGIAAVDTVVSYGTVAGTAIPGTDYIEVASGTVTIAAGSESASFTISVVSDVAAEPDEVFAVELSGTDNPAILLAAEGIVAEMTIRDDDPPVVSIASVSTSEGNSGVANLIFTVSLSDASDEAVSVQASTLDGSARAGLDHVASSTMVTIPAGQTSATVSVPILGDTSFEIDEVFFVRLANPTGGAVIDAERGTARGTIVNDDQAVLPEVDGPAINGTGGDDFLVGSALNDSILGQAGADTEFGNEQSDVLIGGEGDDFIVADFPADFAFGAADFVDAGNGNDNVFGGGGNDTILGGNGNDLLAADTGDNFVVGGDGDNALYGFDGADTILGGNDGDIVFGLSGADVIVTLGGLDLIISGGPADGAADMDFVDMGAGGGSVFAGSGNDTLVGGNGADFVLGESGDDLMVGGGGNDALFAGSGNDTIEGDAGDDLLIAEAGDDLMTGGGGADRLRYPAGIGVGSDRITDFTPAEDTVELAASLGLATAAAALAAVSKAGADAVLTLPAGAGTITFVGLNAATLTEADFAII